MDSRFWLPVKFKIIVNIIIYNKNAPEINSEAFIIQSALAEFAPIRVS